jgi:hypothetical protein
MKMSCSAFSVFNKVLVLVMTFPVAEKSLSELAEVIGMP